MNVPLSSSQNANTNLGYVIVKYAPNGNQVWASRYDSTNYPNAKPSGLVLDNGNNVIITGTALTVKYDANGHQLWTAPYAGTALAVDSSANVYVTGYSAQFKTVKLNPAGSNQWQKTYIDVGPTLSQAILVDSSKNIYVTGSDQYSQGYNNNYVQLLTIRYDTNGVQTWMATDSDYSDYTINVKALTVDGEGNVYIEANLSGGALFGYIAYKYSSNGNLTWMANPIGHNPSALASGIALDSATNVLMIGSIGYAYGVKGYSYYYGTFKLNSDSSTGWENDYPQPPVGSSQANAIVVDSANNVYVTGFSSGTNVLTNNDIVTIKYNSNSNQASLLRYNGPGNGNDAGNAIAVDKAGNVYVTGYETVPGGGTEIVTIKYSVPPIQRLGNGTILLQAQGSSGESFDVQASADLQTWQDLGQSAADTNGLFQYDDTNAPQHPTRFYVTLPQ